jgi:hypothetical protein
LKAIPKLEMLADLSQPVPEIKEAIMHIVNSHPGKQLELLQELDLWLGETITNIEKQIETNANAAATEPE